MPRKSATGSGRRVAIRAGSDAVTGTLLVGVGGFLGAIARYKLGAAVMHGTGLVRFPVGTFAVNVAGCLAIGLLAGVVARYHVLGAEARLFLFTGVLGGFTTFSAFGLESVELIRRGELAIAALYAGGSVAAGLGAVWLGLAMIELIPR